MLGYWLIMGIILVGSVIGIIAYLRDWGHRSGIQASRSRPS
jgi:hypothetical protein